MKINPKRYGLYLFRWQLSTPILAGVLFVLSDMDKFLSTVIANLIGGFIFFWIDQIIFTSDSLSIQWEVQDQSYCTDCGKQGRGYRIVKAKTYDRVNSVPEFRCEICLEKKTQELREKGVI